MQKTGMILYLVTDEFGTRWAVTGRSFGEALAYLAESRDVREVDRRPRARHPHGIAVRIELWDTEAYCYETEQQSWNHDEHEDWHGQTR